MSDFEKERAEWQSKWNITKQIMEFSHNEVEPLRTKYFETQNVSEEEISAISKRCEELYSLIAPFEPDNPTLNGVRSLCEILRKNLDLQAENRAWKGKQKEESEKRERDRLAAQKKGKSKQITAETIDSFIPPLPSYSVMFKYGFWLTLIFIILCLLSMLKNLLGLDNKRK